MENLFFSVIRENSKSLQMILIEPAFQGTQAG